MTFAMGGRKDDVTRMPKSHKKRPLSAVIEEHEIEDYDHKIINKNNNSSSSSNKKDEKRVAKKETHDTKRCEDFKTHASLPSTPEESAGGGTPQAIPLIHVSPPPGSNSPSSVRKTHSHNTSPSPNPLPQNGVRMGRRQALTPNFSPRLGRRGSSSLTSRRTPQNDVIDSDEEALINSDMSRVRQTADRLHLSTRRPSVMQWREQYVECPKFPVLRSSGSDDVNGQNGDEDEKWTSERAQRINTALDWIKNELQEMRTQDQQLARQLLTIRNDLHQLKLARSCEEHQEMLDDVQCDLEELQEFADVLDLPVLTIADNPLKHLGVTRMNFSARRFSTC